MVEQADRIQREEQDKMQR